MFPAVRLYFSLLFHNLLEPNRYFRWKMFSKIRPSNVCGDFVGWSRSRISIIYCTKPHCGTVRDGVLSSIFPAS